ncbi:hypothetical protein K435DRAFT_496727 [Dendrothele bispora CBS 962.96]|uniref:Peptidase S54 rhomboid domain-containing protein n=1 Tax=Dendrothele bispora (strain CBS 962.96) TaxID=1314807 RepID=A0A4S8KXF2_DENBC|nr:hypothetical protein K435DRAFT_496727 [Dendrothele bispora CBS 962.96]
MLRAPPRLWSLSCRYPQPKCSRPFSSHSFLRFPRSTGRLNESTSGSRSSASGAHTTFEESGTSFASKLGRPSVRRQVLFFLFGSSTAFLYAAWRTDLETSLVLERLRSQAHIWNFQTITNRDLIKFQQVELITKLRNQYAYVTSEVPKVLRSWMSLLYLSIFQPYADASEGRRLCWKICLLNAGIWVMWKFRRMQPIMARNFAHNPLSGLSFTLLTSMFSHQGFFHLALNCLALESFGSAAYTYLQKSQNHQHPEQLESTSIHHFMGFFLSAGMFSGLFSHIMSVKFKYPRLIANLSSPANIPKFTDTWASAVASASSAAKTSPKGSYLWRSAPSTATKVSSELPSSLGASGAIYACVTMTALAFPSAQISLVVPPSYPIDIQTGVAGLLLIDVIGALRGWRLIDHWAHLGGAAFGAAYWTFGPEFWSRLRRQPKQEEPSS